MILPVPPAYHGPRWTTPANPREALAARAFLREAHSGLIPGELLPPYALQGEPKITDSDPDRPGWHNYSFSFANVDVDSSTGRIGAYGGGPDASHENLVHNPDGSVVPRAITDRDAATIAQRIYSAAGWPGIIAVSRVWDLQGVNDTCVRVFYSPTPR